jgi:hypothetical protein
VIGICRDQGLSCYLVVGHLRIRSLELACTIAESLHAAACNRGMIVSLPQVKGSFLVTDDWRLELTVRKGEAPTTWRTEMTGKDVSAWFSRFNYLAFFEPWDCVKAPVEPTSPGEDPPIVKPTHYAHLAPMRLQSGGPGPYLTAWQFLRGIGHATGSLPADPYGAIYAACDRNGLKPKVVRVTG